VGEEWDEEEDAKTPEEMRREKRQEEAGARDSGCFWYAVCLLYWYKSAHSDAAEEEEGVRDSGCLCWYAVYLL
jgi:hypothetical protein